MSDRPAVAVAGAVLDELVARAVAGAPDEQCGLLMGGPDVVLRAHPARNLDASPRRYTVDPVDHFAALRAARAEGLAVVGAWHLARGHRRPESRQVGWRMSRRPLHRK